MRPRHVLATVLTVGALAALAPTIATPAARASEPTSLLLPYSVSAGSSAVHLTLNDADVNVVTPTPIDGTGPAAQVALSTTGDSKSYAGFPDPGQFMVSAPGLATGLFQGGAGGLPPLPLTVPPYPFAVSSSWPTQTSAAAGQGPYRLRTSSEEHASNAEALAGLELEAAGHIALLHSTAGALNGQDGRVQASSTGEADAIAIGPLTIGSVRGLAQVVRSVDGILNPTGTIEISGMKVGGDAVTIDQKQLAAGGSTVPLELEPSINQALGNAGITLALSAGSITRTDGGYVVASPALVITNRLDSHQKGYGTVTVTTTIGRANVQFTQFGVSPGPDPAKPALPPSATGTGLGATTAAAGPAALAAAAPMQEIPAAPAILPAPQTRTVELVPTGDGTLVASLVATQTPDSVFDIDSLYLAVFLAAGAVGALALLVRRLGG